jgi:pyruvate dehydrogenase E2 component (dihydrolipoamide acetyltransferase)
VASMEITVPDIGEFTDVPIVEIHVKPGDPVNAEDPLITLESDKATMDVPAPSSGTVENLLVKVGDRVGQGTAILLLRVDEGAMTQPPSLLPQQDALPTPPSKAADPPNSPPPPPAASEGPLQGDVHASPSVRRVARELRVDLTKLRGTGEKGRITKDDVLAFLAGPAKAPAAQGTGIPEIPAQDFAKFGPIEIKPLARIKRLSGPHLHRAWLNIPHVTHNDEADITELETFRRELDTAGREKGYRVTLLAFLMKASVLALKQYPELNSSLSPEKDALILKRYYHIGVAADTPDGLVVRGHPRCRPQRHRRIEPGARCRIQAGARRQALSIGYAGCELHHLKPGRHRRHQLHPDRQRTRGRDPRGGPLQDGPRLERRELRAAADASALTLL